MNKHKQIGLAIIGSGRIGTLRAKLAKMHPSVGFIAVSDTNPEAAEKLVKIVGADFWSVDGAEVMSRPEINAIDIATSEHDNHASRNAVCEVWKIKASSGYFRATIAGNAWSSNYF